MRIIVPGARSFAADGARYAAWQEYSTRPVITVLDSRTGRARGIRVATGCVLANGEQFGDARPVASDGRFMLECPARVGDGILDVRTGKVIDLPATPPDATWDRLGSAYVAGYTPERRCTESAQERKVVQGGCLMLLDIASGAISYRPPMQVVDLNRPKAPPACSAIQREAYALETKSIYTVYNLVQDSGLLGYPRLDFGGDVEFLSCNGCTTGLPGRGTPKSLSLAGGVVTWDTGQAASTEVQSGGPERLYADRVRRGARHQWELPTPPLIVKGAQLQPGLAYGFSAHTANRVFWAADRETIEYSHGSPEPLRFSIYAAPLD